MFRLTRLAQLVLLLCIATSPVRADDAGNYPERTIRMIVAFPPGGGPDPVARIVAQGLERRLGKAIIIENMPGGSGALAARTTAKANPDGYTLQFVDMSFITAPHTTANYGVQPLVDFRPVGFASSSPFAMIVAKSIATPTVGDFIKLAKEHSDQVLIGHAGIGTTPYLGAVAFSKAAGIEPRLISYRGINDAMTNAMGGIISGLFSAASTAINASNNDKLKVLAVTGTKRMPQLPDVPTFAESNIAMTGFEYGAWFGIVAPKGTPAAIVEKLNAALKDLNSDTDALHRFSSIGAEFKAGTPQEFQDFLGAQDALWGKTLTDLGVKPE
jgi:tripartite-type tricarboxylate transporter receptor subunit TctC